MRLKQGLAYDLDETLSHSVHHYTQILQKKFGNPEGLTPDEIISKYRYTYNVPYWQTPESKKWHDEIIHDNDVQKDLPVIKDALRYVEKIGEIIPISCYLTIRPDTVLEGTLHWLEKNGFPKAPVIIRPKNITETHRWKADILIKNQDKIIGIIDDNPKMLQFLTKYTGTVFLYNHKKAPPSKAKVIACKDWKAVYEAVKKLHRNKRIKSKPI